MTRGHVAGRHPAVFQIHQTLIELRINVVLVEQVIGAPVRRCGGLVRIVAVIGRRTVGMQCRDADELRRAQPPRRIRAIGERDGCIRHRRPDGCADIVVSNV